MKAAAVIHMLSLRNLKTESYTRSLVLGGLVAASRHLAVVLGGGGWIAYTYIYMHMYIYIHIYNIHVCMYVCMCVCILSIYRYTRVCVYIYIYAYYSLPPSLPPSLALKVQVRGNIGETATSDPSRELPQ